MTVIEATLIALASAAGLLLIVLAFQGAVIGLAEVADKLCKRRADP